MNVLYLLVPFALTLTFGAVLAFRWAARGDQFDDLESPAVRMLEEPKSVDAKSALRESSP